MPAIAGSFEVNTPSKLACLANKASDARQAVFRVAPAQRSEIISSKKGKRLSRSGKTLLPLFGTR